MSLHVAKELAVAVVNLAGIFVIALIWGAARCSP